MQALGPWLVDAKGRKLLLRGVNLSGSAKVPPGASTHLRQSLQNPESVSFVGRPLPLDEADEHFARLYALGQHFLRLVVTWEAIEHAGPGIYDRDYLLYLRALVEKAASHGLLVWIDPHQDVWSRFTGGDGAPAWTLSAVGMVREHLHACGAALLHSEWEGPLPTMIWPTNYVKLGAATMFTLFFAGKDFAPNLFIGDENVQTYLQRHYVAALCEVAKTLRGLPNVVGYGSMNEPSAGFVGASDLTSPLPGMVSKGPVPSPLQAMAAASGIPQEVAVWEFSPSFMGQVGSVKLNPTGLRLWNSPTGDPWRQEGVWDLVEGQPKILRPDHFSQVRGKPVDFAADYLRPFVLYVLSEIRKVSPESLLFFEGPPAPVGHPPPWQASDPGGVVHAGHFYDGMALMGKHYDPDFTIDQSQMMPVFGRDAVRTAYVDQIRALSQHLPDIPFLLGEFGIPFDLDGGASYRSGDFSAQEAALDGYLHALDQNLLSGTLWNYTPDNDNSHGDHWNGEDLSIYSRDQRRNTGDIYDGGRALSAVVRPYARATCGTPLEMNFDRATRRFFFRFRREPSACADTELFVPRYQYPSGFSVEISAGTYQYEASKELLIWQTPDLDAELTITISPATNPCPSAV